MLNGYITNLGKYNEGELVGKWIEFPITEEELEEVFEEIGINEEYEEFFFTDWEADFDLGLGEYENIDEVNELAEILDSDDTEVIEAIMEAITSDIRQAIEIFETGDVIFYAGQTLEDVAYDLVEECCDLPEFAKTYFDYSAFARDLGFDGYHETSVGVIYH